MTRKMYCLTKKDYISHLPAALLRQAGITKLKKSYISSLCSPCSVREIYSAMYNIMAMEKNAKRLTVNREL